MRRAVFVGIVVGLALGGAAIATFVLAQEGGGRPDRTGPIIHGTSERIGTPQTPSDETAPESCGDFLGDPDVAGTTAHAFAERYGELRFCLLVGDTWVLTTLGKADSGGVVALYECAGGDPACLDNKTDHPFERWTILVPPYRGGVSVLNVVDEHTVIISVGTSEDAHGLKLDLTTQTLTDGRP